MFVTPTIIILQQFVIVMTSVTAIIMGISTVAMIIPQAAYATEDKGNPSSSEDEDCSSDEIPASIDGNNKMYGTLFIRVWGKGSKTL